MTCGPRPLPCEEQVAWHRCGYNITMQYDTIAVLDATSAHLPAFEIPGGMEHEDIEEHLANRGYDLGNCEWQIITSMSIDLDNVCTATKSKRRAR
jgi:hypothetical protein